MQVQKAKPGYKSLKDAFGKFIEIPEDWKISTLGDVLKITQYGLSSKLADEGKYPIFRMNNIENGYIVADKIKFIDLDEKTLKKYKLEKGDLLFNRTNSMELIGKIGIFNLEGIYTFASYLVRLQVKDEMMDSLFLNFYLNAQYTQNRIKNLATPSINQSNVNATNLKKLIIFYPENKKEQEKIASILYNVDALIQKTQEIVGHTGTNRDNEKIKNLKRLKKALMQKLLTGKIRVKF